MSESTTGVAIVGFGFMGQRHARAFHDANSAGHANRLLAVCDSKPNQAILPEGVAHVESYESLLEREDVHLVSLCTPTPTHVDLAIEALNAGKHVLVEKPVALTSGEVRRLAKVAGEASTLCMPAMCMRFWPGWTWLAEAVRSGEFGAVRGASFRRVSPPPDWSREFYANTELSGGALFDLHVHDADFIQFLFGPPTAVNTSGQVNHVTTSYSYPELSVAVQAEGGWLTEPGLKFRMEFRVEFEKAVARFDSSLPDPLRIELEGRESVLSLPPGEGYDGEIRHLLDAIQAGSTKLDATLEDAVTLTRTLQAERESLERKRPVPLS